MSAGFQIGYEVRESSYGKGIFATETIKTGTLLWRYVEGVNIRTFAGAEEVRAHLASLSSDDARYFLDHTYIYEGKLNEIFDDGRLWNHSEKPNCGSGPDPQSTYAIRDIAVGEELLDDYGFYEFPDWFVALQAEYGVSHAFAAVKKPGFQVPYEVRESTFGRGIFTLERIPKDTLIWRYCFDGYAIEVLDEAKYWNHSEHANVCSGVNGDWDSTYAARDIEAGEELLDDYSTWEYPQWVVNMRLEYGITYDFLKHKDAPS